MAQCDPKYPGDEVIAKLRGSYVVDTENGIVIGPLGKEVGNTGADGYFRVTIYTKGGRQHTIRRPHIIWWAASGFWPTSELDHIDRRSTNDRIDNLEESNRVKQSGNRTFPGRTLPTGVHFKPRMKTNPYQAIMFDKSLGFFPTVELAAQRYQEEVNKQ